MLYIFGCGGGAIQMLQDNRMFIKDEEITFRAQEIIFVEDEPVSDTVKFGSHTYSLIPYSAFMYTPSDFGHITAFNIEYKHKMSKAELNWINSYSKSYTRFDDIRIGKGVRINWNVYIDGRARIGSFVKLNAFAFIGHDCSVGDYSYISQHVVLDKGVTIGKNCMIFENSTLLPDVSVGDNTVIGAGSVVTKDIPSNVVAYGSPCKVVRDND